MKNPNDFRFIIPAELSKGKDGSFKIRGIASTEDFDRQGECILSKGIDLSPVDAKRGYLNFDHLKGPENLIGTLDGYAKTEKGLQIEGTLFKSHERAKAVKEIMESLGENDKGRVGLSIEGSVISRDPLNPKIIRKCQVRNVAVTFSPVNTSTFAELVKSFNESEVEFYATKANADAEDILEETFTTSQVSALIKALGIGPGYTAAASSLTGGAALSVEEMDKKPKKINEKESEDISVVEDKQERKNTKKLPKMDKALCKSTMASILEKLQGLYPEVDKSVLWECVKERMATIYPEIKEIK